jgi:hypothetical protein
MLITVINHYGRFGLMGPRLQQLLEAWIIYHRDDVQNEMDRINRARTRTGRYFFANDPPYSAYNSFVAHGIVNPGPPAGASRGGRKRGRSADDEDEDDDNEAPAPASIIPRAVTSFLPPNPC